VRVLSRTGDAVAGYTKTMKTIAVHFLPLLTTPQELAGGIVVVIDVLRASTTIVTALAAGATEVIPVFEIAEAHEKASALKIRTGQSPVLGGERGGMPIEGFNLGNSPFEYTAEVVGGRAVIITTTNGTRALAVCGEASRVLIGAFVNFSAIVKPLDGTLTIHLLCAGTDGKVTREDVLFAGSVVEKLLSEGFEPLGLNDEARIAQDVWRSAVGDVRLPDKSVNPRIEQALHFASGGLNLIELGMQRDLAFAADVDHFDFAAEFDLKSGTIRRCR
jgi:2-phosphosulfolactate phosphatase